MKFQILLVIFMILKFDQFIDAGVFEKDRKVVFIDIFGSCASNMTTDITNVVRSEDKNRKTFINATIQIHRDINSNLQQVFKVVRCKSKETPDSCVEMSAMKVKDGCKFISAKNQIWSPLFQNIQPSFTCPLKKGNYTMINGWLDADRQPFPMDRNLYWKGYISVLEKPENLEVMCLQIEGGLIPVKNY